MDFMFGLGFYSQLNLVGEFLFVENKLCFGLLLYLPKNAVFSYMDEEFGKRTS